MSHNLYKFVGMTTGKDGRPTPAYLLRPIRPKYLGYGLRLIRAKNGVGRPPKRREG